MLNNIGVMIGRFCPIHNGHIRTINQMIKENTMDKSLIILGSCSAPLTIRNLFNYIDRRNFIRKTYDPQLKIIGMPDFPSRNKEWVQLVKDIVECVFPQEIKKITLYGGSEQDLWYSKFFSDWKIKIIDRTEGENCPSGTFIRDLLINNNNVENFVPKIILEEIYTLFKLRWNELCQL